MSVIIWDWIVFESTLVIHSLGNVYELTIVAFPLLGSITFNNQDYVLFCTVVSNIMVYVTNFCVVVTSSCTSSLESPEYCKLFIWTLLNIFILRNIYNLMVIYLPRICFYSSLGYVSTVLPTWLYRYPGYVSIAPHNIYPPWFQHNQFYANLHSMHV